MEDRSQISYWVDDEHVLTVPTHSVPVIGEIMHLNTQMDEMWYDARFNDRKLFHKGIKGDFKVIGIKRYYKNVDYIAEEELDGRKFSFPAQKSIEEFEITLESV